MVRITQNALCHIIGEVDDLVTLVDNESRRCSLELDTGNLGRIEGDTVVVLIYHDNGLCHSRDAEHHQQG